MAGDALELGQDRSNHACAGRSFRHQQFFDGLAVAQTVADGRHVIHAINVRCELLIRAMLGNFLHAPVQVPNHTLGADDALAIELQFDAQHAVRGRMLRSHVQDEFVRTEQPLLLRSSISNGFLTYARYFLLAIPMFSCTPTLSYSEMS